MTESNTIIAVTGIIALGVAGAIVGSCFISERDYKNKQQMEMLKIQEENRHKEAMPDSYWEAKKAEAEASVEIKKLDNEKAIELEKIQSEERIKKQAQRLDAEKDMPEGYFKVKEAETNKASAEQVAKIQAESNERIAKENLSYEQKKLDHELKLEKERNNANETLAREVRWGLNALSSIK